MPENFSFRQRFELAPGTRLPFDEVSALLQEDGGVLVELRSVERKPIQESRILALWGSGFTSRDEARSVGDHWRGAMQRALAGVNVGANFGLRNPDMGGLTDVM